jgi:hypothetical protein
MFGHSLWIYIKSLKYNFTKIHPVGAEMIHASRHTDRQTDGRTDITKQIGDLTSICEGFQK